VEEPIVLASASPRRAHILTALKVRFRVVVSHVDESQRPGEDGLELVQRLARSKAEAVARTERGPVLAADTEVLCDGRVLGKPANRAAAVDMLRQLSGREHEVVTAVCLIADGVLRSGVERTRVLFGALSDTECEWYAETGEPMDKAGGYHVDERGAFFVESIAGSPSNVAGLPVRLVWRLFREAGLSLGPPLA
jgi:septum formation protein